MGLIRDWQPEVNFDYAPTLWRFMHSRKRVRIALGPVGSGKTVTACLNPFVIACEQAPGIGNIRPFKLAVVRNSLPELHRTTIETWLGLYPEQYCGFMHRSTPVSHSIKIPDLGDGTSLHFEAEFFGLDRPDQVKALLSYEPTMIYFNEMREIVKPIVDAAGDRVGRYPSMQKGGVMPTFAGVIGDSNPPDQDHWMYEAYLNPPEGWEFFLQPAGISEVEKISHTHYRAKPGEPPVGLITPDMTVTAPNGKIFAVNPNAENLPNLPYDLTFDPDPELIRLSKVSNGQQELLRYLRKGYARYRQTLEGQPPRLLHKGNYYLSRVPGKKQDWIDGYYRNKFTYVVDGSPVIPEFNTEFMTAEHIDVLPDVALEGGYDMGSATLNSAGVIGQRHPSGIYLVHAELSIDDIGLKQFGEEMVKMLQFEFPNNKLGEFFGDPAGKTKDGIHAESYFDHLKSYGLPVKEAPTNSPELVREAIRTPMTRFIRGRPGILINRKRCPRLVKGLAGAWCFRRLKVAGSDRYAAHAEKNKFSHVCEAMGHWLLGRGEVKDLSRRATKRDTDGRPEPTNEYSYFGD